MDDNSELIISLKQELRDLKDVKYVESFSHKNGYHSLRIGILNRSEIPVEIIKRFPDNLWGFVIDVTSYKKNWYFHRVGNVLFKWNQGHWIRISAGFSPLFNPETDTWDREDSERVIDFDN